LAVAYILGVTLEYMFSVDGRSFSSDIREIYGSHKLNGAVQREKSLCCFSI